jgi:RNA polymerase sigma-70 factor (ECF subfamily)
VLLNNRDDAEDILQETYCKLWDKRDELSQIREPEAFCVKLVKNLCFDKLRVQKRITTEDLAETHLPLNHEITADQKMVNKEKLEQIAIWIGQLPEKQKQVIQLRGYGDCSLEEIEVITGESAVNVRVLLSRARKTLKEKFKEYIHE